MGCEVGFEAPSLRPTDLGSLSSGVCSDSLLKQITYMYKVQSRPVTEPGTGGCAVGGYQWPRLTDSEVPLSGIQISR